VPLAPPAWAGQVAGFRACRPGELPAGFVTGWRFTAPLVDMPAYLGYLQRRLAAAGGAVEVRRVGSLDEATAAAGVVVNCAGVGARELVGDRQVVPVRGQVVVVENPGIEEFFAEDPGRSPEMTYYLPHGQTVVLGGIAEHGDWRREPDRDTAYAILARCAAVEPSLRGARVLDHRVGLRPARPSVRLEQERVGGTRVLHNYGHGGSGVTLSWGCAADVATLVVG
jgi:D-amino-acid oxidase